MRLCWAVLLLCLIHFSCNKPDEADAVFYNAKVYTVDSTFYIANAFAVKDGRFVACGSNEEILSLRCKQKYDLKGKSVYPGLIDAHCHFYGYSLDLSKIWLTGTASFEDIKDTLLKNRDMRYMGWVFGRGWDQNDWKDKSYPDRAFLDSLFPETPVFLMRIDGHAALVNQKALQIAGINMETKVQGGEILRKEGRITGLLIDNAVDLVKNLIPEPTDTFRTEMLMQGQKNCFAVGLTTVCDAGLSYRVIHLLDSLQKEKQLKMRMYVMATWDSANVAYYRKNGPFKTEQMNVRSFKLYADGALGSRGACLHEAYSDQAGHHGYILHDIDSIRLAVQQAFELGFQMNTHCIGDSANTLLLDLYASVLKNKNDLRWRIEHAQVLRPIDFKKFSNYSIIPSVQPTHASSDMYWAESRLGPQRMKGAYAYKSLLKENGIIALGSDFPVESINPLYGFYAAISRRDHKNYPPEGFMKEEALSREEALRAMTIWAAYAAFEDQEKGSIEPGKWADFVILDRDIMQVEESLTWQAKVLQTWIAGEKVF